MGVTNKRTLTKTRRRLRDLDQVKADLTSPRHLELHKRTKATEDLPGLGQFYCVECAKWFESEHSLVAHAKGKPHRRRVKQLKEEPYSQKEAEAAAGQATDNGRPQEHAAEAEEMEMG